MISPPLPSANSSHINDANALFEAIAAINPMQRRFIDKSWRQLSEEEKSGFVRYVNFCQEMGKSLSEIANAYNVIVKDTLVEQIYFRRHGRYRNSSYIEVANAVYQNPAYMTDYMIGLALSGYLWPNHVAMHRFFQAWLNRAPSGRYLEVGPGHGYYFMQAACTGRFSHCHGIDISPTSVALTKAIMSSHLYGPFTNYEIAVQDFCTWESDDQFELIVMAEVLEHVENPSAFLRRIGDLLTPGGCAYITTCINSPAIDHIYLYPSLETLEQQVKDSGFVIAERLVVPYGELTLEQSMGQRLPVNVAMVISA